MAKNIIESFGCSRFPGLRVTRTSSAMKYWLKYKLVDFVRQTRRLCSTNSSTLFGSQAQIGFKPSNEWIQTKHRKGHGNHACSANVLATFFEKAP